MVLKRVKLDIPEKGYSRELYRGLNTKEVVVTLNSDGKLDITTYDSHNNIKDNKTILEITEVMTDIKDAYNILLVCPKCKDFMAFDADSGDAGVGAPAYASWWCEKCDISIDLGEIKDESNKE